MTNLEMAEEYNMDHYPLEILRVILVTKELVKVEQVLHEDFPSLPEGEVEKVTQDILLKINRTQIMAGEPDLRYLPGRVVEEKFLNEIMDIKRCFEDIERAEKAAVKKPEPRIEVLPESMDQTVDSYFSLRDRDLDSEEFPLVIVNDYKPSCVDFSYLFKYMGTNTPRERKLTEKDLTTTTTTTTTTTVVNGCQNKSGKVKTTSVVNNEIKKETKQKWRPQNLISRLFRKKSC